MTKGVTQGGSNKKFGNKLVVLSSAAVLAVYSAGYARTQSAAEKLDARIAQRRPAVQPTTDVAPLSARVSTPSASPSSVSDTRRDPAAKPVTVEVASVQPSVAKLAVTSPVAEPTASISPLTASTPTSTVVAPTAAPVVTPTPAPVAAPVVVEQKAEVAPAPPPPPAPMWKDGTFLGWGTSRHGDIQAQVVIAGGRITSATIAQCLTRYSCDVIEHLQPQPPKRQNADVDTVSRATESADAFFFALTDALAKAK